jgi:hypothetical protein
MRREARAARIEERGVHVDARVDADADHDRRECDRDGAEATRDERCEARRPQRTQDERGHDGHEGAGPAERDQEGQAGEHQGQRAADRQIADQHRPRGVRDRVTSRELHRHVGVPLARAGERAPGLLDEGRARVGIERAPPRGDHEEAGAAPVDDERPVGAGRDACRELRPPFPRQEGQAEWVLRQPPLGPGAPRSEEELARSVEPLAHPCRCERLLERGARGGTGEPPHERGIELVRVLEPRGCPLDDALHGGAGAKIARELRGGGLHVVR